MLIKKKKRTLWLWNCSWLVMLEELNSWGTHQSAILVISLSGWFPTMWSINWRFGLGLQSQETVLHHHILKKTCVTAIHLLRSLHFIIKFVQLLWNSTKFYKTVGTFCAAKQKTYNIQQFRKSIYKPVNQYSILNFFIRIHCTHNSSTRGSLNVEALYPGRNRPLYPDRSISVCVVSPYVFIIAILTVPLSSDSSQGSFTTIAPLATALWLQNWNGED